MERISEVLFALIMVLTFTCSFSIADSGHEQVRTMLIGALGCNIAWGLIDGVLYLLGRFSVLGRGIVSLQALRHLPDGPSAYQIIADALPPVIASVLSPEDFELMHRKLNNLSNPPAGPLPSRKDWLGAFAVFLTVTLSTLPVIIPFVILPNARRALRISNGVAVLMLAITGYEFGRHSGRSPWGMALFMVLLGGVLVGVTICLGG